MMGSIQRALFLLLWLGGSIHRHRKNRLAIFCNALYAEDAGVLDFTVATAGHGAVGWAYPYKDTVITTDVLFQGGTEKSSTSCFVASRHQSDGSLVWRRNVCSESGKNQAHSVATLSGGDVFFTADHVGVVRAWTLENASLLWDAKVDPLSNPKLWVISGSKELVAVASQEVLIFLNAETGEKFDTINALIAMDGNLRKGQTVLWLALANISGSNNLKGVFAYVNVDGIIQSGNDIYYAELEVGNDQFKSVRSWNKGKHIIADSVGLQSMADGHWRAFAIMKSGAAVVDVSLGDSSNTADEIAASKFHPKWTSVVAVEATNQPSIVRMFGKASPDAESTMALFRFDNASGWERLYGLEDPPNIEFSSMMYCPPAELVLSTGSDALIVYRHDSMNDGSTAGSTHQRLSPLTPLTTSGDVFVPDGDSITSASVIGCSPDKVAALLCTERGSTTLLSLVVQESNVIVKVDWAAEEGLSKLSSVVFVDASHLGFDDLVEEQDVVASKLSLTGRLASQWENTLKLVSADGLFEAVSHSNRDHIFGFVKVAALLSSHTHRIWGMNTAGKARGTVRWSLDLPKAALWHSMVHGTTNSAKAIHGINGDTHSREILVLSATPSSVEWMCIDGTSGAVYAQDSVTVSSQILQILPIYGPSSGGCRQGALLLHENLNITVVPLDGETMALAKKQLHKTPNGLYTHYIDEVSNQIQSYQVSFLDDESKFVARPVGSASFSGEQIAKVAYPVRHEEIQSMSTVLGDNSLLLKYINPHMAVVVTVLDQDKDLATTELATVVDKSTYKQPRKPAGAGSTESTTAETQEPLPNIFVNLIDTVSGRVLYRASHSNVDKTKDISAVITENWVLYSYVNAKTRRTEIGVLTLHEGMIDSKGLTFFTKPEQATFFSSFDARESTPVVLAKTYAFPKQITALGVTSTRQGISSQNILLASADGALNSFHKKIFETRRPLGEVKPDEKKEGLVPYRELIPGSPLLSLTYNQTNEPFTRLASAETSLESQSLVLGFGGPDLFFTRTSPTNGFDLLPETFNKILVGIVTVGIVIALFVVQRMGDKKVLQQSWL
jgi:hypothetical protein